MKGLTDTCTIQKRYKSQKMTVSSQTGTPVVGQTVTGGTSHKTAVVTRVGADYIVVKDLSGTFTPGEGLTIGSSWSAALGAVTDYKNQQSAFEWYWYDNQTSVACRFYYAGSGGNAELHETGNMSLKPLQIMLPPTVTIADTDYRIVTTTTGYAGTYDITLFPKKGPSSINHYEAVLTKVQSP
jgi:hypothetical protein